MKRKPTIAIVGRPNTGKSTLFNRILGRRQAIVDPIPGVTIDRHFSEVEWDGHAFDLIDTGGFEADVEHCPILTQMKNQAELAVEESDAILVLFDVKSGLMPADRELTQLLRETGKKTYWVINKVDGSKYEALVADFYELGIDPVFTMSAEHGLGVSDLLDNILEDLKSEGFWAEDAEEEEKGIKIAVVGKPNVGKSSLINKILGSNRLVVTAEPGTTRDAIDTTFIRDDKTYTFIDTAGFRKRSKIYKRLEYYSILRAVRAIERADIVVHLVDSREVVEQDSKIAGLAHNKGKAVIVACNKWDLVENKQEREEGLQNEIARRLWHVSYAPVIRISALKGSGIDGLWELFIQIGEQYKQRISTADLNRFLESLITKHSPPVVGNKPLKLYYMTQTYTGPPTFVVFTNREKHIPASYQKFILNNIRESFGFYGCPIWLKFRKRK